MLKEIAIKKLGKVAVSMATSVALTAAPIDTSFLETPMTPVVETETVTTCEANNLMTVMSDEFTIPIYSTNRTIEYHIISNNHEEITNTESNKLGDDVTTPVEPDKDTISDVDSRIYDLPVNSNYKGFKSYMSYQAITSTGSVQYALQQYAISDDDGFRKLDNRYMIAVGTGCDAPCGTYIDLILKNGTEIPCIVGDIKADVHTEDGNDYTVYSWCASEFIIDDTCLNETIAYAGNVSVSDESWNSKVVAYRIYDMVFDY